MTRHRDPFLLGSSTGHDGETAVGKHPRPCAYYGQSTYTYSLAQGIQDGFLAPYPVRCVATAVDAVGWRTTPGMRDAHGRGSPDGEYGTEDFEASLSLLPHTEAFAKHPVDHLKATDLMAQTRVFCVDQEHGRCGARLSASPQSR